MRLVVMKRILGVAAIALVPAIAPITATPAYAAPPYLADADDPAVTTLAKDLGIPIEEARARIGWQEPAIKMGDELHASLGERFGGLWFDETGGGRVKVGIVGTSPTRTADSTISKWGLTSVTDIVHVRHSFAQLERDAAWLGSMVVAANEDGGLELSSATQVDRNRLVLRTPAGKTLTAAQHATVEAAKARLGSRLVLETWSGTVKRQRCAWSLGDFDCDAPLRGGVRTYVNVSEPTCTTAFNARSKLNGLWYVLTAGHCGPVGTEFRAFQPSTGIFHVIGNVHSRSIAGNDDYAIVKINNVAGWNPRNWVYVHASADTVWDPAYYINGVSTSPVNTRVCISGSTSGTDCGKVVEINWNGVGGFARAEYCSDDGDSGGPIYSANMARGIHFGVVPGHDGDCLNALFQGVVEAANNSNVYVVTS